MAVAASASREEFGAGDLGVDTDSEAFAELVQELGGPPPWPAATVQALFDSRYPGWDEMPTLALSSPITKLRGLAQAFGGDESMEEGLRELSRDMKACQLRLVCDQRGSILQDECSFMLQVLEHVGGRWLAEREARVRERKAASEENAETLARVRSVSQEASAIAREEVKRQVEELSAEAEAQHRRADGLEREVSALQKKAESVVELEEQLEAVSRDAWRLKEEHMRVLEELREAKASKYALVVAHQESEGAYEELTRRIQQEDVGGGGGAAAARGVVAAAAAATQTEWGAADVGAGTANRGQAFVRGARAALALAEQAEGGGGGGILRASMLAWRCAVLQARYARIGASAAAESLEADLSVVGCGGRGKLGRAPCCCSPGGNGGLDGDGHHGRSRPFCCRERWLAAAVQALQDQVAKAEASAAEVSVATATAAAARLREVRSRGFAVAICSASVVALLGALIEPYLDVGNVW